MFFSLKAILFDLKGAKRGGGVLCKMKRDESKIYKY